MWRSLRQPIFPFGVAGTIGGTVTPDVRVLRCQDGVYHGDVCGVQRVAVDKVTAHVLQVVLGLTVLTGRNLLETSIRSYARQAKQQALLRILAVDDLARQKAAKVRADPRTLIGLHQCVQ
nr:hypothetical protein [Deinococcus marmoris]